MTYNDLLRYLKDHGYIIKDWDASAGHHSFEEQQPLIPFLVHIRSCQCSSENGWIMIVNALEHTKHKEDSLSLIVSRKKPKQGSQYLHQCCNKSKQ